LTDVAEPVPAATILMLRDAPDGLETFMVVRHHQIDFASGALVFPGGKVDPGDYEVRTYCDGAEAIDDKTLAMMAGAIREAFEESGVLLARPAGGSELISGKHLAKLDTYRDQLNRGGLSLLDFLKQEDLRLACDCLQHFAHWVTPPMMPKRFDTHFYLAIAPDDHLAVHDGHESVDSIWITPGNAISGSQNGRYTIIFPTLLNIEMLALSKDVKQAMEMARARTVVEVLPWTEQRDDGNYICIPAQAGYPYSEQKIPDKQG